MLAAHLMSINRAIYFARFFAFFLMFSPLTVFAGCIDLNDLANNAWGPGCTQSQAYSACQTQWLPAQLAQYQPVCCDRPNNQTGDHRVVGTYVSCSTQGVNISIPYVAGCLEPKVLVNGVCVLPPCNGGTWQGSVCVCPEDYYLDAGTCVPVPPSEPNCVAGEVSDYGYYVKTSTSNMYHLQIGKVCGYAADGCEVCGNGEGDICYQYEDTSMACFGAGKKTGLYAKSNGPHGSPYVPPDMPGTGQESGQETDWCTQNPQYPGCETAGDPNTNTGTGIPGVNPDGLPGSSDGAIGESSSSGVIDATGSASEGGSGTVGINEGGTPTGVGFGAGDDLQDLVQSEIEDGFEAVTKVDLLPIYFDFDLPSSSCRPLTLGVIGVERQIDLCPMLQHVRDALAWLYSGLLIIYLWRSATRRQE